MNGKEGSHLEYGENLFAGCARIQRTSDVAARSFFIEIGTRNGHREAYQLDRFEWENSVCPRVCGHLEAGFGPARIPLVKLI
jgi:hypothetical protein